MPASPTTRKKRPRPVAASSRPARNSTSSWCRPTKTACIAEIIPLSRNGGKTRGLTGEEHGGSEPLFIYEQSLTPGGADEPYRAAARADASRSPGRRRRGAGEEGAPRHQGGRDRGSLRHRRRHLLPALPDQG